MGGPSQQEFDHFIDITQQQMQAPNQFAFPNQPTEQTTLVEVDIPEHPHMDMFWDNAADYWWVGAIFLVGLAFSLKAIWRVSSRMSVLKEIIKMWKKT